MVIFGEDLNKNPTLPTIKLKEINYVKIIYKK